MPRPTYPYLRYWIRKRVAWIDARLRGECPSIPAPPAVAPIKAPPPAPNDGRVASAMATPPQINLMSDPHTFTPIEGVADPKFACPP